MREIRTPELTLEGIQVELVPTIFSTGSVGYRANQPNFVIDGKKYSINVFVVEQGTKRTGSR